MFSCSCSNVRVAMISSEQLETAVPGTYGSILETVRHLVGGRHRVPLRSEWAAHPLIDEEPPGLPELRATMEGNGAAWSLLLPADLKPDALLVRAVITGPRPTPPEHPARADPAHLRHICRGL